MSPTDIRDVVNHIGMFGPGAVVKRLGRKWTASFRSFGYPGTFKTRREAEDWAHEWYLALALKQRGVA